MEAEVAAHPVVREATAIPVPSALGEDEFMVVVATIAGQSIDEETLLEFLIPWMAHFMPPHRAAQRP